MNEQRDNKQVAPNREKMSMATSYNENQQHFLIEELNIPFLKVNQHLQHIEWNDPFTEITNILDSDLHMYSLEEVALHHPFLSFCLDLIREAIETETQQEDELEQEDSVMNIRAIPSFGDNSIYLIIEDRTLQKQFNHLLTFHHQIEAASHIAAGVAHELRNPLSVIKGFLQLAKLTEDFHKYYDTILSELNRMNGIIEDFLSVSKKKVERNRQSPSQIMDTLIEIIKAECLLHNVEFKLNLTETTKLVNVNESMIKQVMLNLLRNSIEAFPDEFSNRLLTIETKIKDGEYVIYVKDNGKGMPESVLNQIGKPFFTTKESGTGIGIPLCRKIIEDHGGSFQIESTYYVGTTVIISLPLE